MGQSGDLHGADRHVPETSIHHMSTMCNDSGKGGGWEKRWRVGKEGEGGERGGGWGMAVQRTGVNHKQYNYRSDP